MTPLGAADRTDALRGGQDTRAPTLLGIGLLVGWAALVCAGAGIDLADGLGGRGTTGLAFGLVVGAPAAAWTVIAARDAAVFRSAPAQLAIGAGGALVAWTAASIAWAAAPDLAWLDANRMALAFAALVIGAGLGALVPAAGRKLATGLSLVAVAPVAWALATKVLPASVAGESAAGRLQEPVTYSNALGLITAIAVPGALIAAMDGRSRGWRAPLAAAWIAILTVTCLATLSRSGLVLLVVAVVVTIAADPQRIRGLATALAGAIGALLPGIFVVTSDALTSATAGEAARTADGGGLAWRLAVGVLIAVAVMVAYERNGERIGAGRRALTSALLVAIVSSGALAALPPPARGDLGVQSIRDPGSASLGDDPGRLASGSFNNRTRWWGEALDGWRSAPIVGNGAGGFRLVQLQERDDARDELRTVEPHQALLRTLSGTGIVGGVLLVATLAGVAWGVVRAARGTRWELVGAPIAILAAVVLQSLVDWTLAIPALTVAGSAAAGVLLATAAPGRSESGERSRWEAVLVPGAAVLAMLAIVSGLLPWGSQQAVTASRNALAEGDVATAFDRADLAAQLNPLSPQPLWAEAEALAIAGEPGGALGAYVRATELQPDNPATWRRLGLAAGDSELGRAAWAEASALDPQDEQSRARAGLPPLASAGGRSARSTTNPARPG